ncbi:MAG TPA: hypothetical protein VGN16_21995 [Acidobacteriaceae bacterium]|jgi:hypothetical protein
MTPPFQSAVLLTVRGTFIPESLEAMRELHNATAGSEAGIAAARSLGDLSHNVYMPLSKDNESDETSKDLLFLDWWDSPQGLMQFFANPMVQEQGGKLFSSRDTAVWTPAPGASSYHLPAPKAHGDRFLGMIRGTVKSADHALGIFAEVDGKAQRDARRRGLISHELFLKLNAPGESSPPELLGLDVWSSSAGMAEHYGDATHMAGLRDVFTAQPQSNIWKQPDGDWSEW